MTYIQMKRLEERCTIRQTYGSDESLIVRQTLKQRVRQTHKRRVGQKDKKLRGQTVW